MIVFHQKQGLKMKIHADLVLAQELLYQPNQWYIKNLFQESESKTYSACDFDLNHWHVKFRVAKITPTKIGQFVTLWQRKQIGGPIVPYDLADQIDLFVVSVRSGNQLGQFIFPKTVLHEHGVVSKNGKGGKLAIRVYPPWDIVTSKQAQKTQAWQLKYFFEIALKFDITVEDDLSLKKMSSMIVKKLCC